MTAGLFLIAKVLQFSYSIFCFSALALYTTLKPYGNIIPFLISTRSTLRMSMCTSYITELFGILKKKTNLVLRVTLIHVIGH